MNGKSVNELLSEGDKMKAQQRLGLIANKDWWTYKDIMAFFGVKTTKSFEILHQIQAKHKESKVPYVTGAVWIKDALDTYGIGYEEEIKKLTSLIGDDVL